jgi:hypothetical protein
MDKSKTLVIFHLAVNWVLYNLALFIILLLTCVCYDSNEIETQVAMGVFTLGLAFHQYDLWAMHYNKKKEAGLSKPEAVRGG